MLQFYVSVNYGSDIKLASDIVIGTVPLRNIYSNVYNVATAITTQPTAPAQVELALPGPVEPNAPLPDMRKFDCDPKRSVLILFILTITHRSLKLRLWYCNIPFSTPNL